MMRSVIATDSGLKVAAVRLLPDEASPTQRQDAAAKLRAVAEAIDAEWADPVITWEAFVDELATRWADHDPDGVLAELDRLHGPQLYLALACRRGVTEAIRRFERLAIEPLGPAIARVDADPAFVDEVKQRVRTKLLVSLEDGKLSHYAGQGPLATWVRVVAVREAISLRRGPARTVSDDALAQMHHDATGPELGIVKAEYREQFARAFRSALSDLKPDERNLLRLHYLHGLGVDALAPLLKVHRSNAARRIAKVRRTLLSQTRRQLQIELAIGRAEFDQLMETIASRLDLSIERFMGSTPAGVVAPSRID